jgi:hypothetical protein
MSFAGSAGRIWKITKLGGDSTPAVIGIGALAAVLIALAWCAVLCWYLIFGILVIPYRLIRRGQRKRKMESLRHQELLATSTAAIAATRALPPAETQPELTSGE